MRKLWQNYFMPHSVDEALEALAEAPRPVTLIAGGTDLLLDLESGRHTPVASLVDVSRIAEMLEIRLDEDRIRIGAAVPLSGVVEHPLIRAGAHCLVEACELIGGPQVRSVATLGGNVAHGLPAGDGTIALLALDAEAQLASAVGRRWIPLQALFSGPGQPTFDRSSQVLVGFRFVPAVGSQGSAFRRVMRPQGVAIAILNMAVWVHWETDETLRAARLSIGPAGPRPFRARQTEMTLIGKRPDDQTLASATDALRSEVQLRTSPHRATAEYRDHLLELLLRQTLQTACARAESGRNAPATASRRGDHG